MRGLIPKLCVATAVVILITGCANQSATPSADPAAIQDLALAQCITAEEQVAGTFFQADLAAKMCQTMLDEDPGSFIDCYTDPLCVAVYIEEQS